MRKIYVLEYGRSDGYRIINWLEYKAFVSLDRAKRFIKNKHPDCLEREGKLICEDKEIVANFELNPTNREYGDDSEWVDIIELDVSE